MLEIIDVPLREARPREYQRENWLIEAEEYWIKAGRLAWDNLKPFAESNPTLWLNGRHTYNGMNDYVPLEEAAALDSSLRLIHVGELQLSVFRPGEAFGNLKRRVQARFEFAQCDYRLWVTDPTIERAYLAKSDGDYSIGESYLTISLGEPKDGRCYKLVAAVILK